MSLVPPVFIQNKIPISHQTLRPHLCTRDRTTPPRVPGTLDVLQSTLTSYCVIGVSVTKNPKNSVTYTSLFRDFPVPRKTECHFLNCSWFFLVVPEAGFVPTSG